MSKQPVILIFQFDLMSHFFRSLKIAGILKERYEVYFRQTEKYAYWIKESGLKTFKCVDFSPETSLEKLGKYEFSWLNKKNLEEIFLEQVKVIKEYKPDLVIGDMSFTLKMAAEASNVPFLSIVNGYFTKHYKFTRKLSSNHPIYPYINWLPDFVLNPVVKYKEAEIFNLILKEFNKVRTKYDLSISSHYLEEVEGNQTLICDLPEVFPQKNMTHKFHYIGPILNGKFNNGKFKMDDIDPEKHTILLSLGSSEEWDRFTFIEKEEFTKYNIIATGDKNNVLKSSSILKVDFINYSEISPVVDLVICHGGNGTIYNALAYKIPVLCLAHHPEQHWNVQRISKLGYGKSLEKINPKKYPSIIDYWINKKDKIFWELNFEKFNVQAQEKLINRLTEKMIHKKL